MIPSEAVAVAREAVALGAKATPGPWYSRGSHIYFDSRVAEDEITSGQALGMVFHDERGRIEDDSSLIAHAGTHYAALSAFVERWGPVIEAVCAHSDAQDEFNAFCSDEPVGDDRQWHTLLGRTSRLYEELNTAVRAARSETKP